MAQSYRFIKQEEPLFFAKMRVSHTTKKRRYFKYH